MSERLNESNANGAGARWLDELVVAVCERLKARPPDSDRDIYVWSDGTITGPPEAEDDSSGEERRVISVFTPGELASSSAVRESLVTGLESVADDGEADTLKPSPGSDRASAR